MLNDEVKKQLPDVICRRLEDINQDCLRIFAERIKAIGELLPSDAHRLARQLKMGADIKKIRQELSHAAKVNLADIEKILKKVAEDSNMSVRTMIEQNSEYIPYEHNDELQNLVKALAEQTQETYINMTKSTAIVMADKQGSAVPENLTDAYNEILDRAVMAVASGTDNYQNKMRDTLRQLADSGIRTAQYENGYSRRLDTAVRQSLLYAVKQCNAATQERLGKEFGADGWEIDYHRNPRPTHADMGGRQFVIGAAREINGVWFESFEEKAEPLLNEYGCLHFKLPIICGINTPTYSPEELAELKEMDRRTIEFEGKEYTGYEVTQMQRKLETSIRHARDRMYVAKCAGDKVLQREERTKITCLTEKYREFSEAAGLRVKTERTRSYSAVKNKPPSQLEKNKKVWHNEITLESIESIPKVELPGFTDKQNNRLQMENKKLLDFAGQQPEGIEVSGVYDLDMNRIGEYRIGTNGQTKIDNPDVPYIGIHNHPDGRTLSLDDVINFIKRDRMKAIGAVGNNGNVYFLTKSEDYFAIGYKSFIDISCSGFKFKGMSYDDIVNKEVKIAEEDIGEFLKLFEGFTEEILRNGENYGYIYAKTKNDR